MTAMRRVAVTGIGVASPLGHSAIEVFEAARAGRSGVRRLEAPFAHRLASPLAASVEFDGADHFDPARLRLLDRVSQLALVAANRALADSVFEFGATERQRGGIFLGTGMGGINTIDSGYQTLYGDDSDRIKPFMILMGMHNAPAAWIGIEHQLTGPNLTYSTACSSSAIAIGEAWQKLVRGELDMALAGGAEAPLAFGSLKAWEALRTVAIVDETNPAASCKPFSKNRTGMVLGEGAAVVVLETWERAIARGARIYGELTGYGVSTDAGHITRPSVAGQAAAMRAALDSAAMDASLVDAISAHGTGTAANDAVETAAIKAVFGARAAGIPVSATKALHGHLLGATAALEFVLSLMAMQHSVVLPTMHLDAPDPECDLDYVPNLARSMDVRNMISNSFAFGGTNAVLAFRAAT